MEKVLGKRQRSLVRSKRGGVEDLVLIIVVLTVFSIMTLLAYKINYEFDAEVQANADIDTDAKTASTKMLSMYPGVMDNTFLFLLIAMSIGAFILAALVRIHPMFIPIFLLAWGFIVFFAGIFSNVYQEMAANSQLATQANNLVVITNIMIYLPKIVGVVGIILMIIMYKQWSVAQE